MNAVWTASMADLSLLCQVAHPDNRRQLRERLSNVPGLSVQSPDGSTWSRFTLEVDGVKLQGSLFVKRLIISLAALPSGSYSLNNALEFALDQKALLDRAATAIIEGLDGDVAASHRYLVLNCGPLEGSGRVTSNLHPEWLGDGMTTFSLRAFDSRRNRVGTIRVSRHLTVTYGLTSGLIADLNNLIYEKILYGEWPTGSKEVFALLGALGDYVLPTEVSLYTNRIALRLAAFGVFVGVLFAAIVPLQGAIAGIDDWRIVVGLFAALYLSFASLAALAWVVIGAVISRSGNR